MKVTFISDTHSKFESLQLDKGDVLIHCGDAIGSSYGREKDWATYEAFFYG